MPYHRAPGHQAISQVQTLEPFAVVEIRDHKSYGQLARQRESEKQTVTNHFRVAKVLDRDLEPDARREEYSHEPLQQPLKLRDEPDVDVVVATEDESREERPHEERRLGVVGRRHHGEQDQEHERQAGGTVVLLLEPGVEVLVEEGRQGEHRRVPPDDEEGQGAHDGHEDRGDGNLAGEGAELAQDDERDHIIDDRRADDELPDGRVHELGLS